MRPGGRGVLRDTVDAVLDDTTETTEAALDRVDVERVEGALDGAPETVEGALELSLDEDEGLDGSLGAGGPAKMCAGGRAADT